MILCYFKISFRTSKQLLKIASNFFLSKNVVGFVFVFLMTFNKPLLKTK